MSEIDFYATLINLAVMKVENEIEKKNFSTEIKEFKRQMQLIDPLL